MVEIKRKYPSEVFDVAIDFSYNMEETETITNVNVQALDPDNNDVTAIITALMGVSGQSVILRLQNGDVGKMYQIKVEVDTSAGEHYEVDFVLEIKQDFWSD